MLKSQPLSADAFKITGSLPRPLSTETILFSKNPGTQFSQKMRARQTLGKEALNSITNAR